MRGLPVRWPALLSLLSWNGSHRPGRGCREACYSDR
jgi:hypothetical protein